MRAAANFLPRVSGKSIGDARRRAIYSLYLLFFTTREPSLSHVSSSPSSIHAKLSTLWKDSPWDRCPFPPRSCRPEDEDSSPTPGRNGSWHRRNLRSYDVNDANWRVRLTDNPPAAFDFRSSIFDSVPLSRDGIERERGDDTAGFAGSARASKSNVTLAFTWEKLYMRKAFKKHIQAGYKCDNTEKT